MNNSDSPIIVSRAPIRVLLVDDSPLALHLLGNLLLDAPDIEVIGTARDGLEALDKVVAFEPDVICTDLHMPNMNGLELTRKIMATRPCPILVISVSVEANSLNVFKLLEAGAVDVYPKPRAVPQADQQRLARELASKIRIVSGVHVFRLRDKPDHGQFSAPVLPPNLRYGVAPRIITIGASTGGPQAYRGILSALPASFKLPVVCVQHIGSDFLSQMVHWLSEASPLPVREARHGEPPLNGTVYFAPENVHLEFDSLGRFSLTQDAPYDGHRPSVTVTLRSAAKHFGAGTVGILLTGMGRDGAEGMAEIAAAGGMTIAQEPGSCVVFGMPGAAVSLGAVKHLLTLEQIAHALASLTSDSTGSNPIPACQDKS